MLEHQVYARPPGKEREVLFGCYPPSRWQWAVKHAEFLRQNGFEGVHIRDEEESDD